MNLPPLKNLYAPRTLAFGAVNGLVTLIPIHRAATWQKAVVCLAPGVIVASLMPIVAARQRADEPRNLDDPDGAGPEDRALLRPRVLGLSTAVGGLAIGTMVAGLAIDRALERFLDRRGVRRPRVVMAVAGTVIAVAAEYLDSGDDDSAGNDAEAQPPEAQAPASPEDDTEGSAALPQN